MLIISLLHVRNPFNSSIVTSVDIENLPALHPISDTVADECSLCQVPYSTSMRLHRICRHELGTRSMRLGLRSAVACRAATSPLALVGFGTTSPARDTSCIIAPILHLVYSIDERAFTVS